MSAAAAFQDNGPQAALISNGRRLHLQHGPIDLIIEADGAREEVLAAYRQARARFQTILVELVDELPGLRSPADKGPQLQGPVAKRMQAAVLPLAKNFITPMAAVAGSVADEVLGSLIDGRSLSRAFVNNGGDIAFHLGKGERYVAALVTHPGNGRSAGRATVTGEDRVRGIATSGRHGRSHSLGIAAAADAAATMIANAVDLPGSPKIERVPACDLRPDSDLGGRLVTVSVEDLAPGEIDAALDAGTRYAAELQASGLIAAAFLALGDASRTLGPAMTLEAEKIEAEWEMAG
ncbi:MAG: UPF0280 family protein [Rickettsiales bacterium]